MLEMLAFYILLLFLFIACLIKNFCHRVLLYQIDFYAKIVFLLTDSR